MTCHTITSLSYHPKRLQPSLPCLPALETSLSWSATSSQPMRGGFSNSGLSHSLSTLRILSGLLPSWRVIRGWGERWLINVSKKKKALKLLSAVRQKTPEAFLFLSLTLVESKRLPSVCAHVSCKKKKSVSHY